jgi:hypothetical protein
MINLRRLSIVAFAAVLLVAPGTAKAQGTLDQSQTDGQGGWLVISGGTDVAQTFTAGRSGNLVRVDLLLQLTPGTLPEEPLFVEIFGVSDGEPSGDLLAATAIFPPAVPISPDWRTLVFNRPAPSSAGTQYAIVASARGVPPGQGYRWFFGAGDPYPGGERLFKTLVPLPGPWLPIGGDMAFRTYVEPPAVGAPPDPAQKIAELKVLVESLGLHPRLTRTLQRKLARALAALTSDNTARACRSLRGILKHIAARQGKKLTVAQAQLLSDSARDLRAGLGCDDRSDDDGRSDDGRGGRGGDDDRDDRGVDDGGDDEAPTEDSVTGTGTAQFYGQFQIAARSGPTGENPSGQAMFTGGQVEASGTVTCLAVDPPFATFNLQTEGGLIAFTVSDLPDNDFINAVPFARQPTDCSSFGGGLGGDVLTGDIVIVDAQPAGAPPPGEEDEDEEEEEDEDADDDDEEDDGDDD